LKKLYRRLVRWLATSLVDAGYDGEKLLQLLSEGLREVALLWIVFANLDKVVNGRFEWLFAVKNTLAALIVWLIGARLEVKRKKEDR
jgi:hypothetical protein